MKKNLVPLIVLAVLAVFPLGVEDNYYRHLMILFLMWVVIGSAWNLIAGYTGQVSFGDAAFFGSGAYAAGLLSVHLHISAWWGLALGGFVAVATLALNEVMRHSAAIAEDFTGGMVGILIMPSFVSKIPYYYVALGLATAAMISIQWSGSRPPG